MQNAYIITGSLVDERTVTLDERLSLRAQRVRLIVEPLEESHQTETADAMNRAIEAIRQHQQRRGFVPPTVESVAARLGEERDAWGD